MNVTAAYPKHHLLKKHIRYIYFISNNEQGFQSKFYVFSNLGSAISFNKGTITTAKTNELIVKETDTSLYEVKLQLMRKQPVLIRINGR
jgi:hypothetical protein